MESVFQHDTVVSTPNLPSGDSSADDCEWVRKFAGTSLGHSHRIVRHLASGGMGHVFLVEHIQLGVRAAVKLPRRGNEIARTVLGHEGALLSQLQHPNIVSVLDSGRPEDGSEYLLMEYVSGLQLCAWLDSRGVMAPTRAVGILEQVASAVDYLHAHDIVHCDIKPSNIMCDPRAHDFVKLIDFGIACEKHIQAERRGLVGTPAYMAPELARGELCGPAVDIYGVAALALELLTGRPPYDYDSSQEVLTAMLTECPELPSTRELVVPGLDAVFEKGLHAEPAQRYATATQFVEALKAVFQAEAIRKLSHELLAEQRVRLSMPAAAVKSHISWARPGALARSAVRGVASMASAIATLLA